MRLDRATYEHLVAASRRADDLDRELSNLRRDTDRIIAALRGPVAAAARREVANHLVNVQTFEVDVVTFSPLEREGLVADLPVAANGELDEAAFRVQLDQHIWERRIGALQPAAQG